MENVNYYYNRLKENERKITEINLDNEAIKYYVLKLAKENLHNYFCFSISELIKSENKEESQRQIKSFILDKYMKELNYKFTEDWLVYGGYETYYYTFKFSINKNVFTITIPNSNSLNINNLENAHWGKFMVHHQKQSHYCDYISSGYDLNNVIEEFKEYISNLKE